MQTINSPFLWFVALQVVFAAFWLIVARRAIREISIQAASHAKAYALAYVKGTLLVGASFLTTYIEIFEKMSPDVAAVLTWWGWVAIFCKPVVVACLTLSAFIDGSVQKLRDPKVAP